MSNVTDQDVATIVPPLRSDRHPYEVLPMLVSPPVLVVYVLMKLHRGVLTETTLIIGGTLILGCVLTLVGALLPRERDIRMSLQIGICGQIAVAWGFGQASYALLREGFSRPVIQGLLLSIAAAALVRVYQMTRELLAIRRIVNGRDTQAPDRRGPRAASPVGRHRDGVGGDLESETGE
jgi:hypothetical protein